MTGISHPITQIQLCKTAYLLSLYHAITASFNHSLNGFGAVRKGFGIQHKNPSGFSRKRYNKNTIGLYRTLAFLSFFIYNYSRYSKDCLQFLQQ